MNHHEQEIVLCKKWFNPYEWVNASKICHIGLPPKDALYSSLTQEYTTEYEYNHATQNVYERLTCQSFNDNHMTCV